MAEREEQYLGNYRLHDLLGQGNFGEVYLGEHVNLGIERAIKLLYTRVVGDEVAIFQQRASALLKLVHPHIVRVLDFDVEAGTHKPYLVMDYAPNGTLRERHPRGTRLPLPTVVVYVTQIATALQYAHEQGVVHLDVKPENLLLGQNDELLLSDFGIAGLFQAESALEDAASPAAGTPSYMAPEQIEGQPCPASDQYALAILVYEWLAGQPPFRGSDASIRRQHIHDPIPPLREQISISPAVERVVLKALAKTPEERFDSVGDFATALERAASRGISRRTVLFGASGVVGVGLAGTAIWLLVRTSASAIPSQHSSPRSTPTPQLQGTLYLTYRGHSNAVYSVAWSPDGKRIASGSYDNTVQVWDATNGGNVFTYRGHSTALYGVAWSPDGKRIASVGGQTVQVWDAINGGNVFTYHGPSNYMIAVAWSPDGKRIASAGEDQTVQVWDAANGGNVFTYREHSGLTWGVAWSPDSKRIASAGGQTVQVWDAANGGNVFIYHGHSDIVYSVAWSPDGKRIASASADKTVQVWDIANGDVFIYHGHSDVVYSVAWSPDGKRIASGSFDKTVQVWDAVNGGNVFTYSGHSRSVIAVAWSPDGKRIASGSFDNTVQVWQA